MKTDKLPLASIEPHAEFHNCSVDQCALVVQWHYTYFVCVCVCA